jgi:hypothetical protein
LPFDNMVTICWMDCDHPNVLRASLINASEGGLAVRASAPIEAGTQVWILLADGTDGCGEVRYSDPLGAYNRIGLEFLAERRDDSLTEDQDQHLLEWIDASGRLIGSFVSICDAEAGQIQMMAHEVVPCPALVMLSGGGLRILCCTRDWRPEKDSYRVQAELIREVGPAPASEPATPGLGSAGGRETHP